MPRRHPLAPRISLIVPARNEEQLLPALLASVEAARQRYPREVEIVVGDNESSDRTAQIASEWGAQVVEVAMRNIAAVRNGGAAAARGEFLAFLDADSRMHPDTFQAIDRELSNPRRIGGTTGVRFDRWSLGILAVYVLFEPLAWVTRLRPGVYFCRRSDFEAIGGYRESLRFAEDVQLLLDLRRLGRSHDPRQHLSAPRGVRATTSTRKFDQHGDWHWVRLFAQGAWALLRKKKGDGFLEDYWYGDGR